MRSNLVSQHVPLRIVTSCVVLLAWAAPAPAQQQIVWPHQFNNKHYAFLGDLAKAFLSVITNFSRNEPLEEGVTVSVTAKLATFDQWWKWPKGCCAAVDAETNRRS